jgi:Na+/H+-dicarboxylate symporter
VVTRAGKFSISQFITDHRSALLLCVLIAEMIASPAADYHPWVGGLLAATMLAILLAAAATMANKKIVRRVILPIAILWLVARVLEALADHRHFYARAAPLMGLALSSAILWAIFDRARTVPRSSGAAIAEAFIGYLLIATAFAQLYWIFDQVLDKPFNPTIPASQISTLLYFSMITMSSVGYGFIAPVNPYVRMVAAFESVTGVFYIAVVVARLVSSYRTSEIYREEVSTRERALRR